MLPTGSASGFLGDEAATCHAEGERWRFQLWKSGDNCSTASGVDCMGFGSLYNGFVPLGDACQVHFNLGGTFDEDHLESGNNGYEIGISCEQGGGLGCGERYEVFICIDHVCAWGYVETNGGVSVF